MRLSLITRSLLVVCMGLAVAGCQRQVSANVVEGRSMGEAVRTERGVVESVRFVTIQESDTLQGNTTGGLIGAVAGGAAGSRFGGGWGKALAIGAGALVGATAGALAEQRLSTQNGVEYVIRLQNGQLYSIVQGVEDPIAVGTPVLVQLGGQGRARVIRA